MANEIGSFVVNIKAQIEGYQEQINAIKAKLAEIGKDTDIGKKIAKSLKLAESQVNHLGKTMEKRISSESQITALTDNLQNVSRLIMDIGDSFGKVTWDDLNVDGLRDKIQSTKTEIDNLTNSMQENVSKGFTEALAASTEMREVFKTLKIDPAQMGVEEVTEKLRIGLIQATSILENYKAELDKIIPKAEEAAQKMNAIEIDKTKAEQAKASINDIFKSLQIVPKVDTNSAVGELYVEIIGKCDELYYDLDQKGKGIVDKIKDLNFKMLNETDPTKFKEYLTQIDEAFKRLNGKGLTGNVEGFGTRLESIFKTIMSVDSHKFVEGIEQVRTALEGLFADNKNFNLSPEDAKSFIEKVLNIEATKESIEAKRKEVSALIKNYLAGVSKDYKEASKTATELNGSRNTAQKKYDEAQAKSDAIKTAEAKYLAEIKALENKNAELKAQLDSAVKRLEALEKESESRKTGNNSPMGDFGRRQKQTAAQYLNDAANAAGKYNAQLEQVKAREQAIGNIQSFVQRWFSVYAAARLISNAFKSMKTNLKDLDDIMTQISIVTDKTQGDLWKQMPQYTDMAKQYASSIKGVYEVSQLYYQQGLGQNDVMALTEQTLKMAKISGLEYATATDYMTNAIRSFKMEMSDAQQVVDVYSAIAASSATNTAELATAMSKTASSAQSVGSSFESTSAMMAVMIEATRESAENIGSAMKSIISRYGEMTKNPSKLIDSEGEAMSLNKVDTALQSVGISVHDAQGQFRDFDDVITELSSNWDKIDKNTQRYIATIMAGNRQQSRFLALVSNGERLQELTEKAANAEDTATLQVLKTMDSISAKAQQLQTSLQGLYTESGFEDLYKGILSNLTKIIDTFNSMPKMFNSIPVTAIATFAQLFVNIGSLIGSAVSAWKAKWSTTRTDLENAISSGTANGVQAAQLNANSLVRMFESAANRIKNVLTGAITQGTSPTSNELITTNTKYQPIQVDKKWSEEKQQAATAYNNTFNAPQTEAIREKNYQQALNLGLLQSQVSALQKYSSAARAAGAGLQILSATMDKTTRNGEKSAAAINLLGGALTTAGYIGMGPMGWAGAAVTGITTLINVFDAFIETSEEKVKRLQEAATKSNNEFLQKKTDYKELDEQIEKIKELKKARFDSAEANKEYLDASNALASLAPELISYIDSEGNAVLDLSKSYDALTEARRQAVESGKEAGKNSVELALAQEEDANKNYNKIVSQISNNLLNPNYGNAEIYMTKIATDVEEDKQRRQELQSILKDFYNSEYSQEALRDSNNLASALENFWISEGRDISELSEVLDFAQKSIKEGLSQSEKAFDLGNINIPNLEPIAEEINQTVLNQVKDWEKTIPEARALPGSFLKDKIHWDNLNQATQEALLNYFDENDKGMAALIKQDYNIKEKVEPLTIEDLGIDENLQPYYEALSKMIQNMQEVNSTENTPSEQAEKAQELMSNIIENREIFEDLINEDNQEFLETIAEKFGIDIDAVKESIQHLLNISQEGLPLYQQKIAAELNTKNKALENLQTSIWLAGESLKTSNEQKDINKQEMLKNLPNVNDLITQYITYQYEHFEGLPSDYANLDFAKDYSSIVNALTNFYTSLSKDEATKFASLIENKGKYSEKELNTKIASLIGENELDPLIQKAISKYYEKVLNSEKVNQLLEARTNKVNIDNLDNVDKILTGEIDLGADELQKFVDVYDNIALLQKEGSLSMEEASSALEQYATILTTINSDIVPEDKIDEVSSVIENWDDFSLIGLDELRKNLKDVGLNDNLTNQLIQQATDFSKLIPENLIVDFDSLSQKIVTESENFSKALSKASKGMDIKDATEMASKLDVSITDFTFKNGKYFIEKAKAIQQAYTGINDQLIEDLNAEYNSELQSLYTKANQARQNGDTQQAKKFYKQAEELEQKKIELDTVIEQWGKYQTAEILLQMGQIDAFLDLLKVDDTDRRAGIKEAIKSANIDEINKFEELSPFTESIIKTYGEIVSGLTNQLADSVKKGSILVQKNGTNDSYLESLVTAGLADYNEAKDGVIINTTDKTFNDVISWLKQYNPKMSDAEYAEAYETLFDAFNKDLVNKFTNLITDSSVSMKDALSYTLASGRTADDVYSVMSDLGFTFDEVTQSFINNTKDYEGLKNKLEEIIKDSDNLQEVNEAKAKLAKLENQPKKDLSESIENILNNRDKISEDMIKSLANSLEGEFGDFDKLISEGIFTINNDGTYSLDINALKEKIINVDNKFNEEYYKHLYLLLDGVQNSISNATSLVTTGTKKESDINTFVQNYQKYVDKNATADELFTWDSETNSLKLSATAYKNYRQALLNVATEAGASDEIVANMLEASIDELREAIDISSFLSASNKQGTARKKLASQIKAYREAQGYLADDAAVEISISALESGGTVGVNVYKWYHPEATQEELQEAYETNITDYQDALIELKEGIQKNSFIKNDKLQKALIDAGYTITNGVVTDVGEGNLAQAYQNLYDGMAQQSNITTAQLNAAYTDILTESQKGSNNLIDTVKNGMGMSFSDFEQRLKAIDENLSLEQVNEDIKSGQKTGLKLTSTGVMIDNLNDYLSYIYKKPIDDLKAENPEEYISAVNEYREGLINYNKTISDNIKDQFGKLTSANIGDEVNLTYLIEQFKTAHPAEEGKEVDLTPLETVLGLAKGELSDGIAKISNDTKTKVFSIMRNAMNGENTEEITNLGLDLNEIIATYSEIIKSAASEISSAQNGSILSAETAGLLVAYNSAWADKLQADGTIVLSSATEYIQAASDIYQSVKESFNVNKTDLATLNNSFANLIKANTAKDTAIDSMLSSANNLSTDTLSNFATTLHLELENIVDEFGGVTENWRDSIEGDGKGNYQVTNWDNYIADLEDALGHTIDKTTKGYIDSYINWLDGEMNVAPDAEEALMTSLIPNLEKLSYAEIGQIARTFKMTVDEVLALVENNGDNTFNAKDLLNVLQIDKTNEEFARALSTQLQSVTSNMTSAMVAFAEAGADGKRTDLDISNLKNAISDFEKGMQALGQSVSVQNIGLALVQGGETAVAAAEQIAALSGQELSASDIETLYRGQVGKLVNAIDTVVAQPGEIVDAVTASLIGFDNVNEIGETGQYIVETAVNLYEAYNKLLQRMAATGEATLADLNNVAAKALENRDGEQQIIDALGDASNMTYTRFGEILAQQGIELTEQLVDSMTNAGIIKQLGGANMAITDFKGLADIFGWDANSEQFVSAFKTYNESLIQMNRQAERNILEEAQSVANAQGGDWVDLTQLWKTINGSLNEETFDGAKLNNILLELGGKIENGILKLDESADIPAIMQAVAQAAAESGGLLSNEMAQLADTVADAIKSYADLISGAIEGSLTNAQAEQLQDWANKNGVGQLDFTPTENGLKVATAQAQKLVAALKNVDSMQGKLTFDKMVEALSADKGGNFSNISKTTAEIAKAERKLAKNAETLNGLNIARNQVDEKNKANIDKQISGIEKQNSKLKEQISLYREIQQAQSIDPSQYDFMNRDIPEVMQGPINYWNSVGQAFAAMNEAHKTGKMEIQDFYNIVNEMNNLVAATNEAVTLGYDAKGNAIQLDGSLESAAAIIEKGMGALTNVDGKGVKINLEKLGIDFVSGADSAKSNFADGVHALAESQIAMLDAAIKVLEIVVAMEKLGDVDVNKNNKLDIGEIFGDMGVTDNGDFTGKFKEGAGKLLEFADEVGNEELKQALNDISINGNTLREMLEVAANGLSETGKSWEDLNMSEQQYAAVINAFYEALKNGDYNLDTIQQSVWDIINSLMPDGTVIKVGDRTIVISGGTAVAINWKDANVSEIVDNVKKKCENDEEKAKQAIIDSTTKYSNGTGDKIDVLIALAVDGKIKITFNEDGNPEVEGPNGQEFDPNSNTGAYLIAEAAMKAKGIEPPFKWSWTEENGGKAETTIKVGTEERIVFTDSEGNLKYHSERTGQDYNSEQALIDAEIAQLQQKMVAAGSAGSELSYGEAYEVLYHVPFKVNTSVDMDFSDYKAVEKAEELLKQNTETIKQKMDDKANEEFTYTVDQNGIVTMTMDGITVTVKDTGNVEQNIENGLEEIGKSVDYNVLSNQVKTGIEEAFSGDTVTSAIIEAIQSALGLSGGAGGAGNEISIPQIVLQPSSITIDIAQAGQPTLSNTTGTRDLVMEEVILKPNSVKLNVDGLTPTLEGGADSSGTAKPIQTGDVTLVPGNVSLDVSIKKPTLKGAEDNTAIDSDPVTLKPSNVTLDVSSKKPELSGDMQDAELNTLAAKVGTIDASSSKAPTIKKDGMPTATIDTLDATVTTINATAETVDASGAATSIADDIRAKLEGEEFKVKIGLELDLGNSSSGDSNKTDTPDVGDGGLSGLAKAISDLTNAASNASGPLGDVKTALTDVKSEEIVNASKATTDAKSAELVNASKATTDAKSAEMSTASKAINDVKTAKVILATDAINDIKTSSAVTASSAISGISSTGASKAKEAINSIDSGPARNAKSALNNISVDLPSSKETDVTFKYKVSKTSAKGNVGNFSKAKGSGPAKVGGSTKTLMGELGPELVVSNGRYFIAGANGAEFVDLANDAIVFNHLQTRRLMSQGAIGGRGRPTTNEREAVAFAKGKIPGFGPAKAPAQGTQGAGQDKPAQTEKITSVSVSPFFHTFHNLVQFKSRAKGTGPAMASASEALALLKQLRAMWQSLAGASLADMGSNPGRSGGGGGGGGGGDKDTEKYTAGIAGNVERWYNWLKLIETTQNQINKLTKEYSIMDKERLSNAEKLDNLEKQYQKRIDSRETRARLSREQKNYRAKVIENANKGLFSAFYQADSETGQVYLANDKAFFNYARKNGNKTAKKYVNNYKTNPKEIQQTDYTNMQKTLMASQFRATLKNNLSKEDWEGLSSKEKKAYEFKDNKYKLKKVKDIIPEFKRSSNKAIKIHREGGIKTGLDFMDELFGQKDKAGNNIHDAKEQLALIQAFGFFDDTLMAGIDTTQEGWEAQVVENFKNKIEEDKAEIEALNQSIEEQEQAILDETAAIQEINDQIREIVKPIPGITEGFEKWYNITQRIEQSHQEINKLNKELQLYQKDLIANGEKIFDNYKKQVEELEKQKRLNDDLIEVRRKERDSLIDKDNKFITINKDTGRAEFSEATQTLKVDTHFSKIKTTKFNGKEYQIDENGLFRDEEGVLRNSNDGNNEVNATYQGMKKTGKIKYDDNGNFAVFKNKKWVYYDKTGKEINPSSSDQSNFSSSTSINLDENNNFIDSEGNIRNFTTGKVVGGKFGKLAIDEDNKQTVELSGTIAEIIEEITKQDASGKTIYNAEQQYQILKELGLEKYMQYDEKGNKIYEDFGALSKEEMEAAVEAGIQRLQKNVDDINEQIDEINELEQEQIEIQNQLNEIQKALIDNQIEVQDLVKDAIVQEHQDAIDAKKAFADAISDAASRTIEGMRKDLDNEKQTYQNGKDSKELTLLRMQLTTAQMSGSSISKIRDLQKQIQDKQQEMYYNERERLISELEDQTNETVEALNDQTEIAQTSLDYQIKYGEIWEEVNKTLSNLSSTQLATIITNNMPEYLSSSKDARVETLNRILEKLQLFETNIEYENMGKMMEELLSTTYSSNAGNFTKEQKDKIEEAGRKAFLETDGSLEEKKRAAKEAMNKKAGGYNTAFELNKKIEGLDINSKTFKSDAESIRTKYNSLDSEYKNLIKIQDLNKKEADYDKNTPKSTEEIEIDNLPKDTVSVSEPAIEPISEPTISKYTKGQLDGKWEEIINIAYSKKHPEGIARSYYVVQLIDPQRGRRALYEYFRKFMNSPNHYTGNIDEDAKAFGSFLKPHVPALNNPKYADQGGPPYNTLRRIIADYTGNEEVKDVKKWPLQIEALKKKKYADTAFSFLNYKKFKKGGDIDFTGPAWVDGTKNKPEHIFNFEQMESLRAHLLSGVDTTSRAVAGLSNIINNLPDTNTYNNITNDNSGISINNLEFHMEVKEISNDYDARRAGQEALSEMVRIAYKAGNRSIFRR